MTDHNSPEQQALRKLYCVLMDEVKKRNAIVNSAIEGKFHAPRIVVHELCYLQLRMICELIALSCLVAHGDIAATRSGKMKKAYQADWILKAMEKLHPRFYPIPGEQLLENGRPVEIKDVESGFLTKADLLRLYAECGGELHRGTLKAVLGTNDRLLSFEKISEWNRKIVRLLTHHQIALIDNVHEWWVIMQAKEDGQVHVAVMRKRTNVSESKA